MVAMTNLLRLSLRCNATGAEGAVQYTRGGRHRVVDSGIWLFRWPMRDTSGDALTILLRAFVGAAVVKRQEKKRCGILLG